jgi:hypothetical protein
MFQVQLQFKTLSAGKYANKDDELINNGRFPILSHKENFK